MSKEPIKIIDAHHHLWCLNEVHYPWLMARGVTRFFGDPTPIQKDYLPADLKADACDFALETSVHIQVGAAPEDSLKETRWLQFVAEEKVPGAIVAFADLRHGGVEDIIAAHAESPNFRGIRQIVGRHPVEDASHGTDSLIEDPIWRMGLRVLRDLGYSFDLQMIEAQYDRMARLLETMPELKVAICHFASPWDLSQDGFQKWQKAMARFAALPNVFMKFSGFGMFKPDWNTNDIRPYVEVSLDLFGSNRCMTGSNFPVDSLYGGYERIWNAVDEITSPLGEDDRANLFRETARHFYRL